MFHLRLCKGLSYMGIVRATKTEPDVYVPEEENKGNEYIEFKLTDNGKDDSKLTYYNSIEEAILNSPLKAEHEDLSAPEDFLNHVDEILHIWNGKQYDTVFCRAGSDNDPVQGFVIARCKKKDRK